MYNYMQYVSWSLYSYGRKISAKMRPMHLVAYCTQSKQASQQCPFPPVPNYPHQTKKKGATKLDIYIVGLSHNHDSDDSFLWRRILAPHEFWFASLYMLLFFSPDSWLCQRPLQSLLSSTSYKIERVRYFEHNLFDAVYYFNDQRHWTLVLMKCTNRIRSNWAGGGVFSQRSG